MIEIDETKVSFHVKKTGLFRAVAITACVTLLLGFTDFITGTELSFSIFYLLPITIAIFLYGRRLGLVFSFICAVIWIGVDLLSGQQYSNAYIPVWNTLVRLGYFLLHTVTLSKLLELVAEVRDVSFRDPLTKAYNWRYFEEFSNNLIRAFARKRTKVAFAYFDVDNFKRLNDTFGHNIGDQALILLAEIVKNELRKEDLFARLGGDEFVIVLPDVDVKSAEEILKRIKNTLEQEFENKKWAISLSMGCIVFSSLSSTIGPMLKQVDDLMYQVKKGGKNNLKVIEQYGEFPKS